MENKEKGSNLITDGTTDENDDFIKEKDAECPISVSRLGITEPSPSTGESLWQALNLDHQVVKVGPEVDVGFPLQNTILTTQTMDLGKAAEGTITRPIGLAEAIPVEVSSIERISSQTIELLGRIHRSPIRVLLDSGSNAIILVTKLHIHSI